MILFIRQRGNSLELSSSRSRICAKRGLPRTVNEKVSQKNNYEKTLFDIVGLFGAGCWVLGAKPVVAERGAGGKVCN